jgi:hypothetical protein
VEEEEEDDDDDDLVGFTIFKRSRSRLSSPDLPPCDLCFSTIFCASSGVSHSAHQEIRSVSIWIKRFDDEDDEDMACVVTSLLPSEEALPELGTVINFPNYVSFIPSECSSLLLYERERERHKQQAEHESSNCEVSRERVQGDLSVTLLHLFQEFNTVQLCPLQIYRRMGIVRPSFCKKAVNAPVGKHSPENNNNNNTQRGLQEKDRKTKRKLYICTYAAHG